MIDKHEKKGNVTIYHVSKDCDDEKANGMIKKKLKRNQISTIIKDDADVYTEDGRLLLRFRKKKLSEKASSAFYENVIDFAMNVSTNRGMASGTKKKSNLTDNPKIMSNILGYFDKLGPRQKHKYKIFKKPIPKITVRKTRFMADYPSKFEKALPLVKEIDAYYKKYVPEHYAKQRRKANQTPFHIPNTSFTTITTNVNFQTAVHTDKGDDPDGFGNLSVIEHGKYSGGETCFPQYGIGVDVRTGDVLFMDVHQPHGNLPVVLETKDAKRLSIVCYLRLSIWNQTKGKSKQFMDRHNKTMKYVMETPVKN